MNIRIFHTLRADWLYDDDDDDDIEFISTKIGSCY